MNIIHTSWRGMFYGFIGVACFSLTPPFTKLALIGYSPLQITVGRVVIAGLLAAVILYFRDQHWPEQQYRIRLLIVSLGVSIGFPLSLGIALMHSDASHAGIVLAILPLLTSVLGAWLHHERHRPGFWLMAVAGCLTVLAYLFWNSGIQLVMADWLLLVAALSAAIAYSTGADLTRHIGGVNTICWAMVMMLPISIPVAIYLLSAMPPFASIPTSATAAFLYLALVSQLLGFVPWYAGLTLGGVAKVSQVQLLQTFMTLLASALFLNEQIAWHGWAVATLVVAQVYLARRIG